MAKTKKQPEPTPVRTPTQEVEACRKRLTEVVPAYLQSLQRATERFQEGVTKNPSQAMIWHGYGAMVADAVREGCDRIGFTETVSTLPTVTPEEVRRLKRHADHLTDELLRYDDFEQNSTSPFQNVYNLCRFRARQIVCMVLKWVVWEVEYLSRMESQGVANVTQMEPDVNPFTLI